MQCYDITLNRESENILKIYKTINHIFIVFYKKKMYIDYLVAGTTL